MQSSTKAWRKTDKSHRDEKGWEEILCERWWKGGERERRGKKGFNGLFRKNKKKTYYLLDVVDYVLDGSRPKRSFKLIPKWFAHFFTSFSPAFENVNDAWTSKIIIFMKKIRVLLSHLGKMRKEALKKSIFFKPNVSVWGSISRLVCWCEESVELFISSNV